MILTIDRVNDLLDDMADSFPATLFDGLNGGINLLEEAKPDPEFPEGEMYILGEYCDDLLGQYINLYYGSFAALAERNVEFRCVDRLWKLRDEIAQSTLNWSFCRMGNAQR